MLVLLRRLPKIGGERAMSLMEIVVILGVLGVLAATLFPIVLNYLEDAKLSKAGADVQTIAGVINRLAKDVGHFPLFEKGTQTTGNPDFDILRGPGNNPVDNDGDNKKWLSAKTSELEDHLIKNNPGSHKYASDGRFAWRGPYIEKISEDPWGNRYLVNIKNANPADKPAKVVWVLSAGPNGQIETDPDSNADSGPVARGDDIAVRIK